MDNKKIIFSGDELNERLDGQMLTIERAGILLEDAKIEPGAMLDMDAENYAKLMELLSVYETFIEHFRDATEDTVKTIRGMLEVLECKRCETDEDLDVDLEDEE
jgi:hypothetical protein